MKLALKSNHFNNVMYIILNIFIDYLDENSNLNYSWTSRNNIKIIKNGYMNQWQTILYIKCLNRTTVISFFFFFIN